MKKIITLLSVLLPLCTCAQISFSFENGTAEGWTGNEPGRWNADDASPLSGLYSLHHLFDNTEAGTDIALFSIAGLCYECSEVIWTFTLRHGADPSSSNKWAFILTSDVGPGEFFTDSGFNGFAVGVNLTGYDDTLRLWHISEGKADALITSDINWQNDIGTDGTGKLRVTRSADGVWRMNVESEMSKVEGQMGKVESRKLNVESRMENGESQMAKIEYGHEWRWAGISYTYTSTRDRLLWIDDVSVYGVFIVDTVPPAVLSVSAAAPDILRVAFDEEPTPSSLEPSNISLSGGTVVTAVTSITPEVYELQLDSEIINRVNCQLTFGTLCDPSGNCASSVTEEFVPVYAVTGDVVISEIMADPTPAVQLPVAEYLELTNLAGDSLSLKGWILIADNDTSSLPDVFMEAGGQLILCSSSDAHKFTAYGKVAGLKGFPTLNDDGKTLSIRDSRGGFIHAVTYSGLFYKDDLRSGGGWSMEMTDTNNPFNSPDVWRASTDPAGGTPGRPNSATISAPDTRCPEIIAIYPTDPLHVRIVFDETVTGVFGETEWTAEGLSVVSIASDDIADRAFVISFAEPLVPGRIYTLQIPHSACDFSGMTPCVTAEQFGLPESPSPGDILFNEILFNPLPPCSDYIELYNISDRIINLSQLFLSGISEGKSGSSAVVVSTLPRQLLPGQYVALTTTRNEVTENYFCSEKQAVYEVMSLPSMPDDQGTLLLLDRMLNTLDRLDYCSSMHMDFLGNTEGIALEKVGMALSSGSSGNWHSASETCGWGTPGAANSVLASDVEEYPGLTLSSKRVSPDGDGFEDVVSVSVIPGGSDNIVTVTVFNERGYKVRCLAERLFAGDEALIVWDGTGDNGLRLNRGIYMIMAESYNTSGQIRRWKKTCALLYR